MWVTARLFPTIHGDVYDWSRRKEADRQLIDVALHGENNLRERAALRARLENPEVSSRNFVNGTPFFYGVLTAFRGNYESAFDAFHLVGLVLLVVSLALLCRLFGYSLMTLFVSIAFLTTWFQPLRSDVWVGNVNQIQLAMITAFLLIQSRTRTRGRGIAAGFVLGLMVLFKPNLAFVPPLLLVSWWVTNRRDEIVDQMIGLALAGAMVIGSTSALLGGPSIWFRWAGSLSILPDAAITIERGNYGPVQVLREWAGIDAAAPFALLFPIVALLILLFGSRSRYRGSENRLANDTLVVGVAVATYLVSFWMVWIHYYLLLLPLLLFLMRPGDEDATGVSWPTARTLLAGAALVGISVDPWATHLGIDQRPVQSLVVTAALLLLVATAIVDQFRPRAHGERPTT